MRLPASCVQCTRAGRRQSRRVMGDHSGSGEGYFHAKARRFKRLGIFLIEVA
jgi:hypothetical protein